MNLESLVREALAAHLGGRMGASELAAWARDQSREWLSDDTRRYRFAEDRALEALGLLGASDDAPDPREEIQTAAALLRGDLPFRASRLLLVDPAWVERSPHATAAQALRECGARFDSGEPWPEVIELLGPLLARETEGLAGDDYVELVLLEAASICEDLRFAVDGTVEILGPGRPRIDGALLAERLSAAAQVLAGERPLRATLVGTRAIVGY